MTPTEHAAAAGRLLAEQPLEEMYDVDRDIVVLHQMLAKADDSDPNYLAAETALRLAGSGTYEERAVFANQAGGFARKTRPAPKQGDH